ncbi:MAG: hypothetical protein V3V01_11935 [Acidimicrobiales bacterium]
MSPESLSERFRAERVSSLSSEEGLVFSVYRKRVRVGDNLTITRLKTSTERVQILNLHVVGALLCVNGVAASAISLRTDTCPEQLSIAVEPAHTGPNQDQGPDQAWFDVEIWNGWVVDSIEHAWVGDAGIRLAAANPLTLECSDGIADGDFDDLVVEILISSPNNDGEEE